MLKKYSGKLYCFSPAVMLATFVIEISFIFYIIWRYRMTGVTRLIVAILAFLAIFQATEYMICGGMGTSGSTWSRLGYASITLLPPLGLHLVHKIANKRNTYLISAAYATSAAFIAYFVFATGAISGQTCYANYAVFDTNQASALLYGAYYYGWLLLTAGLACYFSVKSVHRSALRALAVGYTAFILPTTVVNLIDPSTIAGIPSIMCGFAVLLAFVLVGKVAPDAIMKNDKSFSLKERFKI